jgi:exopolyphosphatase/guanosine-5'-triphosphate,3'-diphosphate pyrophosphatase
LTERLLSLLPRECHESAAEPSPARGILSFTMKLAALDLGSNSFHLLVADVGSSGEIVKLGSQKESLRLGAVVQQFGQLSEPAFHAAYGSVVRLSGVAGALEAEKLLAVGTSALREARNGPAFCELCRDTLGVEIELLSGDDEARLAYLGARSALDFTTVRALVVDIGGGSVELAVGEGSRCEQVQSLPLGFLRLGAGFRASEPGGSKRLSRYVQVECEKARWQLGRIDTLLLSGGTARALAKLLGGGGASASTAQVVELCERLSEASPTSLLELGVDETRASTLGAGAAVVAGVLQGFGQRELRVSPRGLREGLLLRELARQAPHRAA